jgi:ABC-type lipoprotein release transport system permease subunit
VRSARVAWFLGVRSLARGSASTSILATVMTAAVFISLVFLPGLIAGAQTKVSEQLVDTLTGDLSATPVTANALTGASAATAAMDHVTGVAAATPLRRVGSAVAAGSLSVAAGVDAVDPASFSRVLTLSDALIAGSFLTAGDTSGIVLGIGIAGDDRTEVRTYSTSLKSVVVGDSVTVTLVGGTSKSFTVRGIYQTSFPLSDSGAYITTAAADAAVPATTPASAVAQTFGDVTTLGGQMQDASAATSRLASSTDEVTAAARQLALAAAQTTAGATSLAAAVAGLASAASDLEAEIAGLAAAAHTLQLSAASVADAATAASSAAIAAESASATAQADAVAVATSCPASAGAAFCNQARSAAESAATAAAAASRAATAARAATAGGQQVSGAATELASSMTAAASGAAQLAAAATGLAGEAAALPAPLHSLNVGAEAIVAQTRALSESAVGLSASLRTSSDSIAAGAAQRATTQAQLDAIPSAPGADSATRFVLRLDPGAAVTGVQASITRAVPGLAFQTPAELASAVQDQLDTFALIGRIMAVLSLVVAAITIVIVTYVDLANRRRQLGIERAIGITRAAIAGSYLLRFAVTSLVGASVGLLIYRWVLVPIVVAHPFPFPNGPVTLEFDLVAQLTDVAIIVGVALVAALIPAVLAMRMRIVDAIWAS